MLGFNRNMTGVYIGGRSIVAVEAVRADGLWTLKRHFAAPVAEPGSIDSLKDCFAKMASSFGTKLAASVSIPDSLVSTAFMDIAELPQDPLEALDIVRWRAAKLFNRAPGELRVSFQRYDGNGKARALAAAMSEETAALYEDALSSVGATVERMNIHSFNLDNLLAGGLSPGGNFSVVSALDGSISVRIFKNGVLDFYRCKQVEGREEDIPKELSASFLAYRGKNPDIALEKVYFFEGQDAVEQALALGKSSTAQAEKITTGSILTFAGLNGFEATREGELMGLLAALGALAR